MAPKTEPVIMLSGIVSEWYGITPRTVRRALDGKGDCTIVIHSPGGDAAAGLSIAGLLARHKGRVRVEIDGMAASAASVIAVSGDELRMAPGGLLMVHEPWTIEWGDKRAFERVVRALESFIVAYAATYAAETNLTADRWRQLMEDETWITSAMATELGIATIATSDREPPEPLPKEDVEQERWLLAAVDKAQRAEREATLQIAASTGTLDPPKPIVDSNGKIVRLVHSSRGLTDPPRGDDDPTMPPEDDPKAGTGEQPPAPPDPVDVPVDEMYSEVQMHTGEVAIVVPPDEFEGLKKTVADQQETISDLNEQLDELKMLDLERKIDTEVNQALKNGQIAPAQAEEFKADLRENFDLTAKILRKLPANRRLRKLGDRTSTPPTSATALSSEERRMLEQGGMDPEAIDAYAKQRAAEAAGVA